MFKLLRMSTRVLAKNLVPGTRYRIVDHQGDTEDLTGTFVRHIQNLPTKRIVFAAFQDLPNDYYEEHHMEPEYEGDPYGELPGEIHFTIDRFRFYTIPTTGGRRKLRRSRKTKKINKNRNTLRRRV